MSVRTSVCMSVCVCEAPTTRIVVICDIGENEKTFQQALNLVKFGQKCQEILVKTYVHLNCLRKSTYFAARKECCIFVARLNICTFLTTTTIQRKITVAFPQQQYYARMCHILTLYICVAYRVVYTTTLTTATLNYADSYESTKGEGPQI